jgi:superfamily II DNA or RNA helicase
METKRKPTKRQHKTTDVPTPRLSNTICPEGMTLEEWQRKLRQQEAEKSPMGIEMVDAELQPGEFSVISNSHHYKVVFHAADSPWNYCSCMDFKTSGLGTCKHIEAVKRYLHNHKPKLPDHYPLPAYSSIYLTYHPERAVKLRIGDDYRDEITHLATKYFKLDGTLRKGADATLETFIRKAKEIDPAFRIYPDAMDYIVEARDREQRQQILTRYDDAALDRLLTVPLYPYQREGVRFAFTRGKSIIADEMGLGKTIQAIATAELLRREGFIETVLIMCPTSLKYQWKKEIERFTGATVLVVEGDHLARTCAYNSPKATYKIVSYHSIANDLKVYKSMDCDLLIMDEVQRLKNWNTQIARAARLIHSLYAVVLSGTPLENNLEELYSVMQLVDQFCLGPFYLFRSQTTVTDAETGKVVGYQNLNQIGRQIQNVLLRRTKKQVALQMPRRTDKILYVDLTDEQREIHDECSAALARIITRWKHTHFISETDRKRLLLLMSKMRMVCDSTYIIDQSTNYQTKIDEAVDIINNVLASGEEKIVVFSQWERMARLLTIELGKLGIGYEYLHGGVPSLKRRQLMDNFTDSPASRVFISTDAGSTGLNLQVASILINLDLPWNPAVLEQRIARIYRIGQQNNIHVINMVASRTIEERMLTTLNFKSGLFAGILDEGEDAIFLEKSKFEQMLNTFAEVITPEEAPAPAPVPAAESPATAPDPEPSTAPVAAETSDVETPESTKLSTTVHNSEPSEPTTPHEVINQGINFLKGLSDILSDEHKTEELINTIVRTDAQTGETAIHIPVSDKATVSKIFTTLGKLFSAQ